MFVFFISMSGAAANSSARRRRAKPTEPPKLQNTRNSLQVNEEEDNHFVPVMGIKESIYLLNNKIRMLQVNVAQLNNTKNIDHTAELESLSSKLNDNVIASQAKINILEKELNSTKEKLDEANRTISIMEKKMDSLEEEQMAQKLFSNKVQSLVLYTEDDKNMSDDDDESKVASDNDELKIVAADLNIANITEIELMNSTIY